MTIDPTERMLTINIDSADLEALNGSGYSLCLAKRMDGYQFNTAWHTYSKFLGSNLFGWKPTYELFGSLAFVPGEVAQESILAVPISLGQQSTLDNAGNLLPPEAGDLSTAIALINNFGKVHPGIKQWALGIDNNETTEPNFLTDTPILMGVARLVPTEEVMVWFEQGAQTGTLFSQLPPSQPPSLKSLPLPPGPQTFRALVDFTQPDDQTITYRGQRWQ